MIFTILAFLGFGLWLRSQQKEHEEEQPILGDGRTSNPVQNQQRYADKRGLEPRTVARRRGIVQIDDATRIMHPRYPIKMEHAIVRQQILNESRDPDIPFRRLKGAVAEHPALMRNRMPYMHKELTYIIPSLPQDIRSREMPENDLTTQRAILHKHIPWIRSDRKTV